jgi:DNA-binding NtrC family response regulator
MSTILCIDDEPSVGVVVEAALSRIGHKALLATSVEEGKRTIREQPVDLIISDFRMPGATGIDLLDYLRDEGQEVPVIIMTGYGSIENAVLSMRHGAVDYLTKPLRFEGLRLAVNNALELCKLRRQNEEYQRELDSLRRRRSIVGEAECLQSVMETIAMVAPTRATVLIEGESGTGKELLARAIHEQSPRKDRPFITVNCAAMPEGLVESTLFGHERGAFTGATVRSSGAFERAHRGTLLLDEISEMRRDLQSKLLRAIQEQEFERVGGSHPVKVDVRIIATTNRNLLEEVEAGRFRRDLYYRLNVVPIHTPPLRERLEDIPSLVEHFVELSAKESGRKPPLVPDEVIDHLMTRTWPGNIRELANAVERAVILCRGDRLTLELFGSERTDRPSDEPLDASPILSLAPVDQNAGSEQYNLKSLERRMIEQALQATGGHRARAAKLLGISERTLRNKLNTPSARVATG